MFKTKFFQSFFCQTSIVLMGLSAPYIVWAQTTSAEKLHLYNWAEYIPDYSHMEYMAFPRAIALSEVLWSDSKSRNWDGFKQRLAAQFVKLDYLGVNYRKPGYELDMFQVIDTTKRVVKIHFETEKSNYSNEDC